WYAHKISYPWLLPGFNKALSRILNDFWDTTPSHTNLVEMAHSATNCSTHINLPLLEAIQQARVLDAQVAASIVAASDTCILHNANNSEVTQLTRVISCQTHSARRQAIHNTIDDNIDEVRESLAMTSQAQKKLKSKLKDLTEKKKE
ncbi:hypothetical protein L208DRAFT_1009382, partial [Tricholoma matsutake]